MTEPHSPESTSQVTHREDLTSALFAQLILQQSNMALMLLGKVTHPETGQTYKDVEAARLFIDQLEMLESKTKGNLTREESTLLKQTLMNLRLAFVEAVEQSETQKPSADSPHSSPTPAQPASSTAETTGGSPATEDEHRKKFTKKY